MPIKGGINRRDQLRSKAATIKTKSNVENDRSKQSQINVKRSNASDKSEGSAIQSDSVYVPLEDIMLGRRGEGDVTTFESFNNDRRKNIPNKKIIANEDVDDLEKIVKSTVKNTPRKKTKEAEVVEYPKRNLRTEKLTGENCNVSKIKDSPKNISSPKKVITKMNSEIMNDLSKSKTTNSNLVANETFRDVIIIDEDNLINNGKLLQRRGRKRRKERIKEEEETFDKKSVPKIAKVKTPAKPLISKTDLTEVGKVPGLVLLQNLKNRKSAILLESVGDSQTNATLKIQGFDNKAEIRCRKLNTDKHGLTSTSSEGLSELTQKPKKSPSKNSLDILQQKSFREMVDIISTPESDDVSSVSSEESSAIKRRTASKITPEHRMGLREGKISSEEIDQSESSARIKHQLAKKQTSPVKSMDLNTTMEIRRRKSVMEMEEALKNEKMGATITKKRSSPTNSTEIIHEMNVTVKNLGRKSALGAEERDSITHTPTKKRLSPTKSTSEIIPGLKTIVEIRGRKSAIESETLANTPSKKRQLPTKSTEITEDLNLASVGRASIVRASPYKRSISCLSENINDDTHTNEPQAKLARIEESVFTPYRRPGVTFNNRVAVKQIRGNSFNSESDNAADEASKYMTELTKKINEGLEHTKQELIRKRLATKGVSAVGGPSTRLFSVFSPRPTVETSVETDAGSRVGSLKHCGFSSVATKRSDMTEELSREESSSNDVSHEEMNDKTEGRTEKSWCSLM